MIYSIGLKSITAAHLKLVTKTLDIHLLVDCRNNPAAPRGFSRELLSRSYGTQYIYAGRGRLGSRGVGVTKEALEWLRKQDAGPKPLLLMCVPEAPGDDHRHHRIAIPLLERYGIDVSHIYRNQLLLASECQAAILGNRQYAFTNFSIPAEN